MPKEIYPDINRVCINPSAKIEDILIKTCREYGVHLWLVRSKKRADYIVRVRRAFARKAWPQFTQKQIGRAINKDASTVSNLIHYG